MSLVTNSGWDRTCLHLSSQLAQPFCDVWHLLRFRLVAPLDPKKFENRENGVSEIAVRAAIGFGALFSSYLLAAAPVPLFCTVAVLGLGSRVLRTLGFALQKGGYTHVRGEAPEKRLSPKNPKFTLMTWNICGIGGGLALDHGGVLPWEKRLDALVKQILEEDPDVLVLQEIYDTALAEALISKLKKTYAHFFIHLGPNSLGSVGGCMVLSKCAVHEFSNPSFTNNDWKLNRGFASLELKKTPEANTPFVRVLGTHLIDGYEPKDEARRAVQLAQMVDFVAQKHFLPTVLVGDLNIERDKTEGARLDFLRHGYQGSEPTRTNRLVKQWDPTSKDPDDEWIDYISSFQKGPPVTLHECRLVRAFTNNTKTARSDHHGLRAQIQVQS